MTDRSEHVCASVRVRVKMVFNKKKVKIVESKYREEPILLFTLICIGSNYGRNVVILKICI